MDPSSCSDDIPDYSKYMPTPYPERLMRAGLEEEGRGEKETEATTQKTFEETKKTNAEEEMRKEKARAEAREEIKKNQEAKKARKEQDARDQMVAREKKATAAAARLTLDSEREPTENFTEWERRKRDLDMKANITAEKKKAEEKRSAELSGLQFRTK